MILFLLFIIMIIMLDMSGILRLETIFDRRMYYQQREPDSQLWSKNKYSLYLVFNLFEIQFRIWSTTIESNTNNSPISAHMASITCQQIFKGSTLYSDFRHLVCGLKYTWLLYGQISGDLSIWLDFRASYTTCFTFSRED